MSVGSKTGVVKQQNPEIPEELLSNPKIKTDGSEVKSFSLKGGFSTPGKRLKISSDSPAITEKVFGKLSLFGTNMLFQHFSKGPNESSEGKTDPASETKVFGNLPELGSIKAYEKSFYFG